jgi:hypothetical protein
VGYVYNTNNYSHVCNKYEYTLAHARSSWHNAGLAANNDAALRNESVCGKFQSNGKLEYSYDDVIRTIEFE